MNWIKKNITMLLNVISIVIISISIGSVTSKGIDEGMTTFYKTISFSSKPFNMTIKMYQEGMRLSYPILNVLFFLGLGLLVISSILFYNNGKVRSIVLTTMNILFIALSFLFYQNTNYLLMACMVVTMYMLQISLQSINQNKLLTSIVISSSVSLWLINIYFLIRHFTMMIGVVEVVGVLMEDLINISRINAICISLFMVPCIVSLVGNNKNILLEKNDRL